MGLRSGDDGFPCAFLRLKTVLGPSTPVQSEGHRLRLFWTPSECATTKNVTGQMGVALRRRSAFAHRPRRRPGKSEPSAGHCGLT